MSETTQLTASGPEIRTDKFTTAYLNDLREVLQIRQCNLTFAGDCMQVIDEVFKLRKQLDEATARFDDLADCYR